MSLLLLVRLVYLKRRRKEDGVVMGESAADADADSNGEGEGDAIENGEERDEKGEEGTVDATVGVGLRALELLVVFVLEPKPKL